MLQYSDRGPTHSLGPRGSRDRGNGYDRVTQSYAGPPPSYTRDVDGSERVSGSYGSSGGGGRGYGVSSQAGRSMEESVEEDQHDLDSFIDSGH